MISLFLAVSLSLSPMQQHANHIAAGESLSPEGFYLTLCTIRNRLESPEHPDTLANVLRAYYAPPKPLSASERLIAASVWAGESCPPYRWAMSKQDRARKGFRPGDYVIVHNSTFEQHFYIESPFDRRFDNAE